MIVTYPLSGPPVTRCPLCRCGMEPIKMKAGEAFYCDSCPQMDQSPLPDAAEAEGES